MKTIVEHVSLDEEKRIIVISDIHRNIHRLKKLLDKVSLKRDETLVLCGDLLEKGPSSLKTLLFLYQLSLTQKMVVLKGNCDMVVDSFFGTNYRQVLSYINRRKNSLFLDLAQEFNLSLQTEEDVSSLFKVSLAHYLPQLRWIKELPHIVRTENFLFVHAGLDYGIDYLNNSDSVMNQEHYFFDEWIQPKTMIVGHMPVSNYNEHVLSFNPLFSQEKNLICIDGGNVIDELGQLNALIISKGLFSFDYVDDFELTSSMYDQMGSRDSLNITWFKNEVIHLGEVDSNFIRIKYVDSGKEIIAEKRNLYKIMDVTTCFDTTDYELEVKKGEEIAIIREYNHCLLAKKKGIVGWIKKGVVENGINCK